MTKKHGSDESACLYYIDAIQNSINDGDLKGAKDNLLFLNNIVKLLIAQRDNYYKTLRRISGGGFNYDDEYYEDIIDLAKESLQRKF